MSVAAVLCGLWLAHSYFGQKRRATRSDLENAADGYYPGGND